MTRNEGEELTSIDDCVDNNIKKSKERLISTSSIIIGNMRTNRKATQNIKQKWEKKNNCIDISSDKTDEMAEVKTWT